MSETTAVTPHYASVQMQPFGNAALPALQSLADVVSIAQLMAKSQMAVPKHLRENPGACLAVTMQALRWNADPFAVANKSYYVNDRMAYEAQMFAAVINTMAPIKSRPKYAYEGEGPERVCIVTVETKDGEVIEQRSPKFKDITPKNSPLWKSDPDQQQGYYTIRTMARRHFPDVVLGIYDPDEMESVGPQRIEPQKEDLVGKLSSSVAEDGFDRDRVEVAVNGTEPTPPKRRGRPPKAAPEPEEAMHAGQPEDPQSAAPAESAAETPASSPSPEPSDTSPTIPSNPTTTEPAGGATSASPSDHAAPGEIYLLAADKPNDQGRQLTYIDGVRHSSVMNPETSKLKTYAAHAPEVVVDDAIPEHMRDDSGPATVEEAQAEVMVPLTEKDQEAVAELERDEALAEQRDGSQAGETREMDEPDADDFPPPFADFISAVESASAFQSVKLAMRDFFATDFWKALAPERQNKVRANVWQTCLENKSSGQMADLPDQADDVTGYRLWIECQSDVDAIRGTRDVLARSDQWAAAPDALRMAIDNAVEARVAVLEGE